jgi:hypothetical protein
MATRETPTRSNIEELVSRWDARTSELAPERASVPLHVLLGDAVDLAAFVEAHYEPVVVGHALVPGLASVEPEIEITRETARELIELQRAIAYVHSEHGVRSDTMGANPLARADRILAELRASLAFLLEGSGDAEGEHTLRRLREAARASRAHDAVAMVLEGYVALASRYEPRLAAIGVSEGLLDDAIAEAHVLRLRSANRIRATHGDEDMIRLRNRLIAALNARLRLVRRAIRYVFREHPELASHAASGYSRIRRAASSSVTSASEPPEAVEAGGGSLTLLPLAG